jgi:PKHD-type hydroxylase
MLTISDVLSSAELERIHALIAQGRFVEGTFTAGGPAARAKKNLLLDVRGDEIDQLAIKGLMRNAEFQAYAVPSRFAPPMVTRSSQGMRYGNHIDSALMGRAPRMRCDLSITLFLSDPDSYEGGELVMAGAPGIKLPAGSAVVYPSDALHRVEEVRRGDRIVLVTWAQSMVRDEQIRAMLFDLRRAIEEVEALGNAPETENLLIKTHANLTRKFAEV